MLKAIGLAPICLTATLAVANAASLQAGLVEINGQRIFVDRLSVTLLDSSITYALEQDSWVVFTDNNASFFTWFDARTRAEQISVGTPPFSAVAT